MTAARSTWSYGEGSPDGVPGYGGYTDVAKSLSAAVSDYPVSRQLVYTWHRRRASTGFPERHEVQMPDGRVKLMFKLDEVVAWYRGRHAPAT